MAKAKLTAKVKDQIKEIKEILDNADLAMKRIADAEKLATELLGKGFEIKGYMLSRKLGMRRLNPSMTPSQIFSSLKNFVFSKDDLYKPKELKSAAQLEKYFKEDEKAKKRFNEKFVVREDKGLALAKDSSVKS